MEESRKVAAGSERARDKLERETHTLSAFSFADTRRQLTLGSDVPGLSPLVPARRHATSRQPVVRALDKSQFVRRAAPQSYARLVSGG